MKTHEPHSTPVDAANPAPAVAAGNASTPAPTVVPAIRAAAEASDMSAAGGASAVSTTGVARTTGFETRVGGVCSACAMHAVARITRTIMLTV